MYCIATPRRRHLQCREGFGDKTRTSSSLCVDKMRNSFAHLPTFIFRPPSCRQEKWLLLALLAIIWKTVMNPWTRGRRKMLNVSFLISQKKCYSATENCVALSSVCHPVYVFWQAKLFNSSLF